MKRILLSLAIILLLLPAGSAQASPLLYTFEGTVTNNPYLYECEVYHLENPYPGAVCQWDSVPGYTSPLGTPVEFVVRLDFSVDVPGCPDHTFSFPAVSVDGFLAEYVSGPLSSSRAYSTCGFDRLGAPDYPYKNYLFGFFPMAGYPDEFDGGFRLLSSSTLFSDLVVGDHIWGDNRSLTYGDLLYEDLVLTSITPEPVPEPASLLLFGTGLAGLRAWRKRRQ